ncbi:MAG: DciA family protein [Patescibacteria group bacterium]
MFQEIKKLLSDRLRQQGIAPAVEAAAVAEAFKEEVKKRFGPSAADSIRRVVLQGDTLQVSLSSPGLASELRMIEIDLVDSLKARLNGRVYRLRIFA